MKRRTLIKTLGISAIGLATIPLWMDSWKAEELPLVGMKLNEENSLLLAELVDAIIPATDTPGAKELQVDRFISVMVADCYDEKVQKKFLMSFQEMELISQEYYNKPFGKTSEAERKELLCALEIAEIAPDKKINFISFIKGLTIAGYMSSAYVMENHTDYEMVPSRFHGSFPVSRSIYSNL